MKWNGRITESYQETAEGATRAHSKYYLYKVRQGEWRAGRYWFNRDVDFRLEFSSAKAARDYLEMYDREAVVITAVTA